MFIDNEHYPAIMFIMDEQKNLSRSILKEIVLEQQQELALQPRGVIRERLVELISLFNTPQVTIITGVRRCGKSTLLTQLIDSVGKASVVHYLNFEDERLISFNVSLFNLLLEVFYEVNGKHPVFIFDEIQVVEGWEHFVRRLHNGGNKVVITGSNASMLSQELGSKLTGRHLDMELFPFSYAEFLRFNQYEYYPNDFFIVEKRSELLKYFSEYLQEGGFPFYVQNRRREVLSTLYEDIIARDVLQRFKIESPKLFRELALYFLSNNASLVAYSKLKEYFRFGSVNTVIKYVGYLESCYFLFVVNQFTPSFKKQINSPKKIYSISNAFVDKIGFHFSNNLGGLLENCVFLALRNNIAHIFYYKTKNNLEVDFIVYDRLPDFRLIQVAWSIIDPQTKEREVNALVAAMQETHAKEAWILTLAESEEMIINDDMTIHVMPVYQWLLSNSK